MIAMTRFVASVTIVRSESLVGLPCGPTASQNTGNPSRFKSYFPIPLYVSPARPARNRMSPCTCAKCVTVLWQPALHAHIIDHVHHIVDPRHSLPRDHPAATTPLADPRYRAGSFPSALYAARVAKIAGRLQHPPRLRHLHYSFFAELQLAVQSLQSPVHTSTRKKKDPAQGHPRTLFLQLRIDAHLRHLSFPRRLRVRPGPAQELRHSC